MKLKALLMLGSVLVATTAGALNWETVKTDLEADGYYVKEIRLVNGTIKVEATKNGSEYEFVFDSAAADSTSGLLKTEIDGESEDDDLNDDDLEDDDSEDDDSEDDDSEDDDTEDDDSEDDDSEDDDESDDD